jgi:S-adenosylmethionine:tRNA ribosyltransferase-isomerase
MNLNDFNYDLPQRYIAQEPVEPRDSSKLMIFDRETGSICHKHFYNLIEYLHAGDTLVLNTTRVIPARIPARRADTNGKMEILLLRQLDETQWRVLVGGKRADVDTSIAFEHEDVTAVVKDVLDGAERIIAFNKPINYLLTELGEIPLPPYIQTHLENTERYQTIYSNQEGSAAAPTAGLHFTPEMLIDLRDAGVKFAYCTLHIGLDTFQPVKVNRIEDHKIHSERAILTAENAKIINDTKLSGGRVIAVGTTSARTLETAAILSAGGIPSQPESADNICSWRPVVAFEMDTNLFIYPGYKWRVVDGMITNFHLPKSSLLMMISSFAGRESILNSYEIAKENEYRFFSFGDAMFIT